MLTSEDRIIKTLKLEQTDRIPTYEWTIDKKIIEARAFHQKEVFEAAVTFARTEGSLCAPETAHCLRGAIDEALKCKETGEEKCIVIAYSGHGFFDLGAYEKYFSEQLEDYEYPEELIQQALSELPDIK